MTKNKLVVILICSVTLAIAASKAWATGDQDGKWQIYSQEANGDVYFFDPSRVMRSNNLYKIWSRIRYKTSVMGASSYQSLLEIDCSERTEKILQNTFFSDWQWQKPAMKTDKANKPKRLIQKDSATERLSKILCDK